MTRASEARSDSTPMHSALERQAYQAVLMDCQLPEMDGFESSEYHVAMVAVVNAGLRAERVEHRHER